MQRLTNMGWSLVVLMTVLGAAPSVTARKHKQAIKQQAINLTDPGELMPTTCPPFDDIVKFLHDLEKEVPGVSVYEGGRTYEDRPILGVTVRPYVKPAVKNAGGNAKRDSYWMEGGMDANSCDTITLLLSMIYMLAKNCPTPCSCAKNYFFVPVGNPDGYEYARTVDGRWIKNREPFQINRNTYCYGVNLNYNFPPNETFYLYGSNDPCSTFDRGAFPGSTEEVSAIIKMKHSVPKLTLGVSFFNFSRTTYQRILYPPAYTTLDVPNGEIYKYVTKIGASYIYLNESLRTYSYSYRTGKGGQSGTSMDYWYHTDPSTLSLSWFLGSDHIRSKIKMGIKAKSVLKTLSLMADEYDYMETLT